MNEEKQVVAPPMADRPAIVKAGLVNAVRPAPRIVSLPTLVRPAPVVATAEPKVPIAKSDLKISQTVPSAAVAVQTWRFAKLWGVCQVIKFPDKTEFQFRLIRRNAKGGYSPTSSLVTSDPKLAENLRWAAKTNKSIREIVN